MAPRSFWKGYLKLSLVTCPVAMLPATSEADKVSFLPCAYTARQKRLTAAEGHL